MLKNQRVREITAALLAFGESIERWELIPALSHDAARLIYEDPFAFVLAASLDRGIPAEVAWTFPLWIREWLGHLDPARIARMSVADIGRVLDSCPRRHRYTAAAPRTVKEVAALVMVEGKGDARKLWEGKSATAVHSVFMRVYGIGEGLASMIVALLDRVFRVPFSEQDRRDMDVKPDVHVVRVLARLGLIDPPQTPADRYSCDRGGPSSQTLLDAVAAAREMCPAHPSSLDAPLWIVGRRWCDAYAPKCRQCPLSTLCPHEGATACA